MLGERYIVVHGDNLWRIAAKTLGGGKQWPRIWRYNNRPAVIRITGRSIANPDLIYVGQVLLIPRLPTQRRTVAQQMTDQAMSHLPTAALTHEPIPTVGAHGAAAQTSRMMEAPHHKRSLSDQLKHIRSPVAIKYRLELNWPAQDVGTAILDVRMTGDLVFTTKKSYPPMYVNHRPGFELQMAKEAHDALGKLVSDNRFIFDAKEKRLTYRSMLVTQSTTPNSPATAIGVEMASNAPIPKLRAEIRIPKLEGSFGIFNYVAIDNKIVVGITPKPQTPISPQSRRLLEPEVEIDDAHVWKRVLGVGLAVTTAVLVVGLIADDVFPIGVADDAAGLAAASTMLAHALALMGAHANLPKTPIPAHIQATATVVSGL